MKHSSVLENSYMFRHRTKVPSPGRYKYTQVYKHQHVNPSSTMPNNRMLKILKLQIIKY